MSRDFDPRDQEPPADARGRSGDSASDPTEVFVRDLELPDGARRERVGKYALRGSEVRILAATGSFRVIPQGDLERAGLAPRRTAKDVAHLRREDLLISTPYVVGRERCALLTLTEAGRALLENSRREHTVFDQAFRSGPSKQRELAHDSRLFQAYVSAAEGIERDGGRIRGIRLESELKTAYQRFLQEPNRHRPNSTGRPRNDLDAIRHWASAHGLPVTEDSVRFPDLRIEYERPDGSRAHEDIEVITPNYRGAHLATKAAAGFSAYRYPSARIGGERTSGRGSRVRESRLAEEMLR